MLIAASFVKVTMASSSSIHEILFLLLLHKYATLETIEYVFPVPAPASTKVFFSGDACSTQYC